MTFTIPLIVTLLLAWAIYRAAAPRSQFRIRLTDGRPLAEQAVVARVFLAEVGRIARQHGVLRGTIRGMADGSLIRLRFSEDFPPEAQQQIRNVWAEQGWSPPPEGNPRRRRKQRQR